MEERWFIEVCCETDSMLATVAQKHGWKAFRITQENPLEYEEARVLFAMALEHLRHGGHVHAWFSLPCTAWSSWQRINLSRMADPTTLAQKREASLKLQELFHHYRQVLMAEGGEVSFEWPAYCDGWNCDRVQEFMDHSGVTSAICHGCMLDFVSKVDRCPMKKPFQIVSTNTSLTDHMATFKCDRSHGHAPTQGSDTVRTGNYTERFCEEVISVLRDNGTSGSRVGVPNSLKIMEMQTQQQSLYSGKEKNGYTVDSVNTTAWMDILEIDYQRKLRLCENHSDSYRRLLLDCPHLMEPVGDDQEVPDFFATPVMKPLTLNAHTIFDDKAHRAGWIEAVQAELDSFDALEVMDSVPDKGQKAIPSQLVATVKPSNAVTTLLESEGIASKGADVEGGSLDVQIGGPESTAKDAEGSSHFVIEYPVFPPSAAKKGKKNVKNKQEKRFTEQSMDEEVYSKGKKKVRIVCCGNLQEVPDFEYTSTQTPAFSMLRLALAMASVFGWVVGSADISTAFLYASLHQDDVVLGFETIYVRPPKVLVTFGLVQPGILWKLKKSLYGLRTSPLAWE
eukprot:1215440-Amphidinium_carterae.2